MARLKPSPARSLPLTLAILSAAAFPTLLHADINRWDTLQPIPGTHGVTIAPHANLSHLTLQYADLNVDDLTGVSFLQSDLTAAQFQSATLTNANFSGALIQRADFSSATGFTTSQLLSTASYQQHNLTGINFSSIDLHGVNFTGQFLPTANFSSANLTNATLANATIRAADLGSATGLTLAQITSTASYQQHTLNAVGLESNDLTGADLSGQDLTYSLLFSCTLANVNLTNADLRNNNAASADFSNATLTGANILRANFDSCTGLTISQLITTASYHQQNLAGTIFSNDTFIGADFSSQNLSNASFSASNLSGSNFANANLTNADFSSSTLTLANLANAIVLDTNLGASGITKGQLASTTSYQQHNLAGINLSNTNMSGANFTLQNLANADFSSANLTAAAFSNATIHGANFTLAAGLTFAQISSTTSFQQHDLSNVSVAAGNLTNWNLAGQNLANASFNSATLTNANLTNANVQGADFTGASNLTFAQITSTASFQQHNLTGIRFGAGLQTGPAGDLSGWDFTGQNLTNADLSSANLTNTIFTNAIVQGTHLSGALTFSQLASTASFQQHNLTGIGFDGGNLDGWNLSGQNLTNAVFDFAGLGGNLTNTNLTGASFADTDFTGVTLTGATLDVADLRGSIGFSTAGVASTNGTILPDGTIPTLHITSGQTLTIASNLPNAVITAAAPSIGAGASLAIHSNLASGALINNGTITQDNGTANLGVITGVGSLSLSGGSTRTFALTLNSITFTGNGYLQIDPNSATSKVNSLTFAGSLNNWIGNLNITNNKLIVQPTANTKAAVLANLRNQVAVGITTSGIYSYILPSNVALAVIDNAALPTPFTTFGGLTVDPNSILIAPELLGDANADNHVDLTDLSIVLNNFGATTPAWTSGNFDNASTIDLTDLSFVLNNFGLTNPNANISDFSLQTSAFSTAPEPASLTALSASILLLSRRRKHCR